MDVPCLRAQGRLEGVRHDPSVCCLMQHRHDCPAAQICPTSHLLPVLPVSVTIQTQRQQSNFGGAIVAALQLLGLTLCPVKPCREESSTWHRCLNRLCCVHSLLQTGYVRSVPVQSRPG